VRAFPRYSPFVLLFAALITTSLAQTPNDGATAIAASGQPGYIRVAPQSLDVTQAPQALSSSTVLEFPADAISSGAIFAADANAANNSAGGNGGANSAASNTNSRGDSDRLPDVSTIDGLDSLATFSGAYINQAGPRLGQLFNFTMVGNNPRLGGTTVIPAQITTVNLVLLKADGSVNATIPFTFRDLIEDSPNFAATNYRSGHHLQYADAIHRAQFFHIMGEEWHTELRPGFVNDVTFTIPRFVNVRFPDGSIKPVQAYFLGTAPNGNHFVELLDLLFNFLWQNQAINDILSGNFTTNGLSSTLFPDTYLFSIDNQGHFAGCCVLGFHTYFFENGVIPQPRWVTQFASWISPGLFGSGFQDVTALSHETSEVFGDPFLNNATAPWQFPGVPPTAKICQSNLEEGDPIEVLPTATIPITLRERHEVFVYHPQIIPLLQWFEMGKTSNAVDGAFSFPNEATLPHSALPCPQ
jgi:hypothetical protein